MKTMPTAIAGVVVVETEPRSDHRGSLTRFFCSSALWRVIGTRQILQINHSQTRTLGAVRGLHYQRPPCTEMKLVRCIKGRVWDVAVDLRANSMTFMQWHAEELTPGNARMLVIAEGCAHGFQALEANSELLYLHTGQYVPAAEGGVRWDDPALGIKWPLAVTDLSKRDHHHPRLPPTFLGLEV